MCYELLRGVPSQEPLFPYIGFRGTQTRSSTRLVGKNSCFELNFNTQMSFEFKSPQMGTASDPPSSLSTTLSTPYCSAGSSSLAQGVHRVEALFKTRRSTAPIYRVHPTPEPRGVTRYCILQLHPIALLLDTLTSAHPSA